MGLDRMWMIFTVNHIYLRQQHRVSGGVEVRGDRWESQQGLQDGDRGVKIHFDLSEETIIVYCSATRDQVGYTPGWEGCCCQLHDFIEYNDCLVTLLGFINDIRDANTYVTNQSRIEIDGWNYAEMIIFTDEKTRVLALPRFRRDF